MTFVCAPTREWPSRRPVDLYEFTEGPIKRLYGPNKELRFIDVDWKQDASLQRDDVIISYHNDVETPELERVLSEMKARHPNARYYKLATYARSTLDALRMLHFQRQHPNVIGLCMGEEGRLTRILAPLFGAPITYAPLTEQQKNAPGQLLWSELSIIYHFKELKKATQIYGLIGDPVRQSIGHLFHNDQFRKRKIDAVYVKMRLQEEELSSFFELIDGLPIYGLSVTAPLKEKVFPYLSDISKEGERIGAVNTLIRTVQGWFGDNTDSRAAADSLGDLHGKRVVILGAGGAAKAIAYSLIQRKAFVTIVNRTPEKGKKLAQELHCEFSKSVPLYDILINATSSPQPLPAARFIRGSIVMDIAIRTTPFLLEARSQGCQIMDGLPMFFNQALGQQILFSA